MNRRFLRDLPWIRIFAEGVVIMVSILLAFSIDAWWDGRQDRVQEVVYLQMLASDARQTLTNNATFGGRADSIDWAGARLVRAYYEPEPPPPDSILEWFSLASTFWVVQPTLGTAQTLVSSTGDLDLIRDHRMQLLVSRYLTNMTAFEGFEQQWADAFASALYELSRHVDLNQLRFSQIAVPALSAAQRDSLASSDNLFPLPKGPLPPKHREDVQALVRDEEVHRILSSMNRFKTSMRLNRTRMREGTEELLREIDAALAALGAEPWPGDETFPDYLINP